MEKIVEASETIVTGLELDGTECAVKFSTTYTGFEVKNNSGSDITVSLHQGRTSGDGVATVPTGSGINYMHGQQLDTVYITGNGSVDVAAKRSPHLVFPTEAKGGVKKSDFDALSQNVDDISDDVDLLESRFDNAISAITTDTEVTDIRVGADGTTYQTAGEAVRGQVGELKQDIDSVVYKGINLYSTADVQRGYLQWNGNLTGESSNYYTTDFLPVENGQYVIATLNGALTDFRFALICNSQKEPVEFISEPTAVPYQINNNDAKYIRLTMNHPFELELHRPMIEVNSDGTIHPYEKYGFKYLKITSHETDINTENREKTQNKGFEYSTDVLSSAKESILESTEIFDELGGYTILAKIDLTDKFNTLCVGKGNNEYYGGHIEISKSYMSVYYANERQETFAHGLSLKDYLHIKISASSKTARASFYIDTNGGSFSKENAFFDARHGKVFLSTVDSNIFNNCKLSYYCKDWNNDIWLFGDSYFNLGDPSRWTSYLNNRGHQNFMLNGFPGRNSASAIIAFDSIIKNCCPKKLIWCLGMNDADSDNIVNDSWMNAVQKLMEYSKKYGFELILATIPNVQNRNMKFKNEIVKKSGYRYIDFASAVGANNDTEWYTGMLSADGVHPDVQGALALYTEAITDIPELNS